MPSFKATIDSAAAEGRFLAFIPTVDNALRDATHRVAYDMAQLFASVAPKGASGRLGRGIRVLSAQGRLASGRFATGTQFAITASATDSRGYDYVGVSRFGHLKSVIVPREDRAPASVVATRRPRATEQGRAALRIPLRSGPGGIFRHSVRGLEKSHDWVQDGVQLARAEVAAVSRDLAHQLEVKFNA